MPWEGAVSRHEPLDPLGVTSGFRFDEIPHSELKTEDWQVLWSAPWNYSENILRTEGRALVWGLRHKL
eukprot:16374495-Heterocapsa_arctica.AAC.1